jgi:hypothetical protein
LELLRAVNAKAEVHLPSDEVDQLYLNKERS